MFPVHGDWKIFTSDTYVLQWFSGCWNEEAAIMYSEEFRQKTLHLAGTKWALLSIFDEWELGVPEIIPHIEKHCQRFKDIGCIKDCHVYTPSAAKEMQLEQMVPQTEGSYERQVFTNLDDAVTWLKVNGFKIKTTEFLNLLSSKQNNTINLKI